MDLYFRPTVCNHCPWERRLFIEWDDYMPHLRDVHEYKPVVLYPGQFRTIIYKLLKANQLVGDLDKGKFSYNSS